MEVPEFSMIFGMNHLGNRAQQVPHFQRLADHCCEQLASQGWPSDFHRDFQWSGCGDPTFGSKNPSNIGIFCIKYNRKPIKLI